MSFRSLLLAVLAASLGAQTVAGQQAPPSPAASARQAPPVHTVRIDALAVDAQGAAVRTLTVRDFELREDGKPVTVDDARFVEESTPLIAVYVDEYHISAGASADRARAALTELVDRHLGAADSIVVMKPLDSVVAIRGHDRDEARRIIAGIEGRRGDYTPRTDYERTYMAESPERIETARQQVAVSALNALAVYLGTLGESRKTLLLITETLEEPARRRGQEYLATISSVVGAANRSNIAIYPINPAPGSVWGPPAGGSTPLKPDPTGAGDGASNAVLRSLAEETNGRTISSAADAEDLAGAIGGVLAEAGAYYMFTYRSAPVEDGTFHPVHVSVKRPGVEVRARAGYWAPAANDRLGAELLAAANRPPAPVRFEVPRRISPLIRPWFGLSRGDAGKMRVTFVWEPSAVVPGDAGRVRAARLELTAVGEGDAVLFEGPVLPTGPGTVNGSGSEPSRAVFDVAPGRLRLRMTIQDVDRRDVDLDVRDFAIRDLRGTVAIGTPQVLRARNARELRLIGGNPQAVPVSAREFSRAERLLIRFPTYAPEGQRLSVTARLLNRMGQPMRTLEVQSPAPGIDAAHEINLSLAGLASGEYQIELEASSPSGGVREVLTFRVTS